MFNTRRSKLELRRNFEKRLWQSGENFSTYFHAKTVLANKASIAKDEWTEYLIDGILDNRMRDQARMQQFSTADDMLKAFTNLTLPTYSKGFQRKKEERTEKTDRRYDEKKEEGKSKTKTSRENRPRCFNCSEFGHLSSDCTKPVIREKGSCFRCGSKTNKIRDCPEESKKNQPSMGETAHVIQSDCNTKPLLATVKYTVIDNNNNIHNSSIKAIIDTGSPISLIREDYVPRWACKVNPSNIVSYYGINKSKIDILNMFKIDCIVDDSPVKIKFYVVPIETITFAAILGRDYILSPQCENISVLVNKVRKENTVKQTNENELKNESNDIFQIDCISEPTRAIEKLKINPQLDYHVSKEVENLFQREYLEKDKIATPPQNVELVISLKHDQPINYRPRRLSYSDKQNCRKFYTIC